MRDVYIEFLRIKKVFSLSLRGNLIKDFADIFRSPNAEISSVEKKDLFMALKTAKIFCVKKSFVDLQTYKEETLTLEQKARRIASINQTNSDEVLIKKYRKNIHAQCQYYTVIDKKNAKLRVHLMNGDIVWEKEVLTGKESRTNAYVG